MNLLYDKKLDYLPTANDIILDEIVKEITHHIEQDRTTTRGVDKKTIKNEYLVSSWLIIHCTWAITVYPPLLLHCH